MKPAARLSAVEAAIKTLDERARRAGRGLEDLERRVEALEDPRKRRVLILEDGHRP